jgi:hypothetical protein
LRLCARIRGGFGGVENIKIQKFDSIDTSGAMTPSNGRQENFKGFHQIGLWTT